MAVPRKPKPFTVDDNVRPVTLREVAKAYGLSKRTIAAIVAWVKRRAA